MATQLQKFNGKNLYNNRVYVDFRKKKVEFEPVIVNKQTQRSLRREFILQHLAVAYIFFLFSYAIYLGIAGTIAYFIQGAFEVEPYTVKTLAIMNVCATLLAFGNMLDNSMKRIKDQFPHRNAQIAEFAHRIQTLGLTSKYKRLKVNKEAIINNMFIIPKFSNVVLEYKATGDFAKQIKNIKILNHYKNDAYKFLAVIQFKKKPQNGNLYLDYI